MKPPRAAFHKAAFVSFLAVAANANADVTLAYETNGHDCHGDFDRLQLKGAALRVDSNMGGRDGSFVYDGIEKLAYALDHREHRFMQVEVDEDAAEFNADRMASVQKMMRNQTGVDPFEQARSLCPGAASGDAKPGQPVNCAAAGGTQSPAAASAKAPAANMPAMSAQNMQAMQQLMQQQMAKMTPEQRERMQRGMAASGFGPTASMPALAESDRDVGPARVGDIACTRRQRLRGDEVVREECLTSLAGLNLAAADNARITRIAAVLARWRDSMLPAGFATARRGPSFENVIVERVCFAAGAESGRATLRVSAAPVADSEFVVPPPGYAPMSMGMPGEPARH
jgi:hypothetical protein